MNNTELKPCPFCGGEAYTYTSRNHEVGKVYLVHCKKCRINYPCDRVCKTEEDAIEAWNTRKHMDNIVAELKSKKSIIQIVNIETNQLINLISLDRAIGIIKAGGVE